MDLVRDYQNTRNLEHESVVDDILRQKEVNYYVCSVFFHHWFMKDLDQIPEPSFGPSLKRIGPRVLLSVFRGSSNSTAGMEGKGISELEKIDLTDFGYAVRIASAMK